MSLTTSYGGKDTATTADPNQAELPDRAGEPHSRLRPARLGDVAGAPERCTSASCSGTDCLSAASRQRLRQYRTVLGQTPSSRALARTPMPSAARTMMWARRASCCGVEWVRTRRSSASRCSGKTVTGSAASRGMATSCSSSGFVLPQHSRFDSLNLFAGSGVKTSARLY